ncbi:sugar O-acyltransferase [Oleiphilus sp. HI0133]|nr:sugar O-acyltransferase [Oleiphilus sp. HI0133]
MSKPKKLIIIGAVELAEIAFEYFTYDSDYTIAGFCVEAEYLKDKQLNGLPVSAVEDILSDYPSNEFCAFVAIPSTNLNRLRTRLYLKLKNMGYEFATYISSRAFVWRNAKVGENCFIFENNVVQPFVTIGDNCILWSGNHIGHRTVIEDHCFLSSHVVVSGYCSIGHSCFLGVNATFNDNTTLAHSCIVGSASLVNKSLLEPESIYVGSPAKIVPGKSSLGVKL